MWAIELKVHKWCNTNSSQWFHTIAAINRWQYITKMHNNNKGSEEEDCRLVDMDGISIAGLLDLKDIHHVFQWATLKHGLHTFDYLQEISTKVTLCKDT